MLSAARVNQAHLHGSGISENVNNHLLCGIDSEFGFGLKRLTAQQDYDCELSRKLNILFHLKLLRKRNTREEQAT